MRVLIVAPANCASRRILESIVATGYENACLVVSQEYFYEWHESSYEKSLSYYVHTRERKEDHNHMHDDRHAEGNGKKSSGGGSSSRPPTGSSRGPRCEDREAVDFLPRTSVKHEGKWTQCASSNDSNCPRPRVVIGTFGCMAGSLSRGSKEGFGVEVSRLVDVTTITMVVIDETSQLWEGYALGLLSLCPNVEHFVFVGDDKQLAPFGASEVRGLRSLFTAALRCSDSLVPKTMLNTTFRLTPTVAAVISSKVYNGELQVCRPADADEEFLVHFKGIAKRMKRESVARALVNRFTMGADSGDEASTMAWITHSHSSHVSESNSTGNESEAVAVAECCAELLFVIDDHRAGGKKPQHSTQSNIQQSKRIKLVILTPYLEV